MRKSAVLTLLLAGFIILGPTAARGACPAAAEYTNPANPTGPLVTLASLGVTNCFYIAANGSDSNDGLSEASGHPWLHAPDMPAATGNPAAHTPVAGDGFILRGGDTWHFFTGSPLIGLPSGWPTGANGYAWHVTQSGTATNPIYWGVDQGWSASGTWTRPVVTNDNPTFKPSAPVFSDPTTTSVASCTFPQGNLDDMAFTGPSFYILDNFEFTGMCFNDNSSNSSQSGLNEHNYIKQFQGGGTGTHPHWFTNNYFHGWSHTAWACPGVSASNLNATGTGYALNDTGTVPGASLEAIPPQYKITGVSGGAVTSYVLTYPGTDTQTGTFSTVTGGAQPGSGTGFKIQVTAVAATVCGGPGAFYGATNVPNAGAYFEFNVCDGSDSDDLSFECIQNEAYDVEENVFTHFAGTQIINNCHSVHDNLFAFINNGNDGAVHGDMWFCNSDSPGGAQIYNNLVHDIATEYNQAALSTVFWLTPLNGQTDYFYNNVHFNVNCNGNCDNIGQFASQVTNSGSTIYVVNNTMQSVLTPFVIFGNVATNNFAVISQNNHFITNNGTGCGAVFSHPGQVNSGVTACPGDFFQTLSVATSAGYTAANLFAPTSSSSPTVGIGANETSISGPFGAAFLQTTTAGCSYVTGNHSVSCPRTTPSNRPTTGACPGLGCWSAGAWASGASTVTLAPTPYAFATTALGSNSSDSPVTFTLTNNTGVTITGVTVSFTGANPADFTETTSCVTTLASSASCQIFVTFTPTAAGSRTATLSVSDSDASSPQTSSLSGTAISSVINPSPANPVTFGVVVTDPSIPSTVKNEKHSKDLPVDNFDHVALVGFLHQDRARSTASPSASQ